MPGGFSVTSSGTSVQQATGPNVLLSMNNPFTKLDVTNPVSFQTISLLFNHEPPQPVAPTPLFTDTLVYQFKHGYDYVPAIWLMWQNPTPQFPPNPTISGTSATTFYPFGDDTSSLAYIGGTQENVFVQSTQIASVNYNLSGSVLTTTSAMLSAIADETNVYIHIVKQAIVYITPGNIVIPVNLNGVTLNMRCYVFTEPATTTVY